MKLRGEGNLGCNPHHRLWSSHRSHRLSIASPLAALISLTQNCSIALPRSEKAASTRTFVTRRQRSSVKGTLQWFFLYEFLENGKLQEVFEGEELFSSDLLNCGRGSVNRLLISSIRFLRRSTRKSAAACTRRISMIPSSCGFIIRHAESDATDIRTSRNEASLRSFSPVSRQGTCLIYQPSPFRIPSLVVVACVKIFVTITKRSKPLLNTKQIISDKGVDINLTNTLRGVPALAPLSTCTSLLKLSKTKYQENFSTSSSRQSKI